MIKTFDRSFLRQTIIAGIAGLTLAGAAQSITPAQAFPIAAAPATSLADGASPLGQAMVDQVYYRRYYRYHRRYGYLGYRRFHRGGVPVPCRSRGTFISKRYC